MRIRLARVSDAPAILELQKLCYQSEAAIYGDSSIPPLQQTLDEMIAEFENKVVLKGVENGRIIGSVHACRKDETCSIERLIRHPEFQNRGFGKELLGAVETIFQSARRLELYTGEKSLKNLALYSSFGYREFKRETVSGRLTLVHMEKMAY